MKNQMIKASLLSLLATGYNVMAVEPEVVIVEEEAVVEEETKSPMTEDRLALLIELFSCSNEELESVCAKIKECAGTCSSEMIEKINSLSAETIMLFVGQHIEVKPENVPAMISRAEKVLAMLKDMNSRSVEVVEVEVTEELKPTPENIEEAPADAA